MRDVTAVRYKRNALIVITTDRQLITITVASGEHKGVQYHAWQDRPCD